MNLKLFYTPKPSYVLDDKKTKVRAKKNIKVKKKVKVKEKKSVIVEVVKKKNGNRSDQKKK